MRFSRGNAGNAETADDFCKIITRSLAFLLGRKGLEMEKHAYGSWKTQLMLAGLGIVIGALVGCLDTIFGKVLLWVSDIRTAHIFYLVPALPLVGVCIVWAYKKYGGRSGEGMGLILSVSHREDKEVPRRLIPFVMISTWLTHLFGGSAGREGVAVQLGATVSHQVGKRFSIEDGTHIFLLTGMAAGFAGLGTNLISASFYGEDIYAYDWILKILLTVFTLSLGFQGGEVTPLFSIGASLGVILAGFMGLPVMLAAALGYAAVFGSATNTLLAPIFIGAEVFGYEYLPLFTVACLAAHIFCHFPSIYGKQKHGSYRKSLLQLAKRKEKSI